MTINVNEPTELEDGSEALIKTYGLYRIHAECPSHPDSSKNICRIFDRQGIHITNSIPNLRNKIMLTLNHTKPLIMNNKSAKIIHVFPNGNLAVVVEGDPDVYTFEAQGRPLKEGGYCLINKVEETFRYLNVWVNEARSYQAAGVVHPSLSAAQAGMSNVSLKNAGGVRLKQTLRDGVVVKTEIVD